MTIYSHFLGLFSMKKMEKHKIGESHLSLSCIIKKQVKTEYLSFSQNKKTTRFFFQFEIDIDIYLHSQYIQSYKWVVLNLITKEKVIDKY